MQKFHAVQTQIHDGPHAAMDIFQNTETPRIAAKCNAGCFSKLQTAAKRMLQALSPSTAGSEPSSPDVSVVWEAGGVQLLVDSRSVHAAL